MVWKKTLLAGTACLLADTVSAQIYAEWAANSISVLNSQWYNQNTGLWTDAWWNSANTLTTLADFAALRPEWAASVDVLGTIQNTYVQAQRTAVRTSKTIDADGMITSSYCMDGDDSGCALERRFLSTRGSPDFLNHFYDDEGWWALGLIRAYDATGNEAYLNSAVTVFSDMQTGMGGSCGGIFWNKDRDYTNAITNELYLAVAASLAKRTPSNPEFLSVANAQWTWFRNSGLINSNNQINDGLNSDDCQNNGLQTWSYNQGVILGALVELSTATGDRGLIDTATTIARVAIDSLSNENGILMETDRCELAPGNCGLDGRTFKGVFTRNVRYLWEANPQQDFYDFLIRNSESIWANDRNAVGLLGVAWQGPFVDGLGMAHSSALDTLVATVGLMS